MWSGRTRRVRRGPGGDLHGSPDLEQVLRDARATSTPGLLIDANEIILVTPNGDSPTRSYQRQQLTIESPDEISVHFSGLEG